MEAGEGVGGHGVPLSLVHAPGPLSLRERGPRRRETESWARVTPLRYGEGQGVRYRLRIGESAAEAAARPRALKGCD